jgi:hypothetical protein
MTKNKILLYTYTEPITGCKCVKAVTNYVGQTLFAIAKCDPTDEFNQEFGEKLATMRLNLKIAKRRVAFAKERAECANEYNDWLLEEQRRVRAAIKREELSIEDRTNDLNELTEAYNALLATV